MEVLPSGLNEPEHLPEAEAVSEPVPAEAVAVEGEEVVEAAAEEVVEELVDTSAEIERLRAESRGRLGEITGQREELRSVKEQLAELNKRLTSSDAPPAPDKDEAPIDWLEAQQKTRADELIERLDRLEQNTQQQQQAVQIQQVQSAVQEKLQSELAGDAAKTDDFTRRYQHTAQVYTDMALANGATPQQAAQAVSVMALKLGEQARQAGQSIYDLVMEHSTRAGYVAQAAAPVAASPVVPEPVSNPALAQPVATGPVTPRVSLGSLAGNPGQRKITLKQLDGADDSVYAELYANDSAKWEEIQKAGYTYV